MPKVYCKADLIADSATMMPGTETPQKQGRWKLNAGSEMIVAVQGINKGEPIRLVLDLAACKPKNAKIHALSDHDNTKVIGYWDNFECVTGGIYADLHLVQPKDAVEAEVLPEAVRTNAMIRSGVPIQVSVGADAGANGTWELAEGKVSVNGREYDGSGDIPLYILRGGELFESSIVPFGADDQTGRLAAKKHQNPVNSETSMSDSLKVLLGKFAEKHHGLVARCVAEGADEAAITAKVHASDMDEKDKALKAASDKIAGLEAELAKCKAESEAKASDYAQRGNESQERESVQKMQLAAGSTQTVKFGSTDKDGKKVEATSAKTMTEAMKVIAAAHPELKGFALRKAARAAFPNAEEK